jgi:hypothetical protein
VTVKGDDVLHCRLQAACDEAAEAGRAVLRSVGLADLFDGESWIRAEDFSLTPEATGPRMKAGIEGAASEADRAERQWNCAAGKIDCAKSNGGESISCSALH